MLSANKIIIIKALFQKSLGGFPQRFLFLWYLKTHHRPHVHVGRRASIPEIIDYWQAGGRERGRMEKLLHLSTPG